MVQNVSVENNFTGGLKTEFTGLNFPENAATDTDNCVYSIVGNVSRRFGIDYENNYLSIAIPRAGAAMSEYKWNNAGGDGNTQIFVMQVGSALYFWKSSAATATAPMSRQFIAQITLTTYQVNGTFDISNECEFSDGNGYLFVYHPNCDPIYFVYSSGVITPNKITVQIRDFIGVPEPGVAVDLRPANSSAAHLYNLANQGWGEYWQYHSSTAAPLGQIAQPFNIGVSNAPIKTGDRVRLIYGPNNNIYMDCTVLGYTGTNVLVQSYIYHGTAGTYADWYMIPLPAYLWEWVQGSGVLVTLGMGNYPSNSDVWFNFKDTNDVFDPTGVMNSVSLGSGPAPKGSIILEAFNQLRSTLSGVVGVPDVTTTVRPRTGAWFQGRVWYTGVDAPTPTWTESIYFSQIVVTPDDFGHCFQVNDPTSDSLFDILPSDGGVIQIQGCGAIYKLFPVQNGLLVFAANGIWFITGSQGIGFTATDYTVVKISSIESISHTSFVNVMGYPVFWNEEGIYRVSINQQAQNQYGLSVDSITVSTIATLYDSIPKSSKKYVRGSYHPIDYVIQWTYRDTEAANVTEAYQFNKILNYNVYSKAFYPFTVGGTAYVHGVTYIEGPGGITTTDPVFKYPSSHFTGSIYVFTFADENNEQYLDFLNADGAGENIESYFVTGYKLHGQGVRLWQPEYIYMYYRSPSAYSIQGIWNYATSGNSGKYSNKQLANSDLTYFDKGYKRHRIRGHGTVLQVKVASQDGLPFDIMGWGIMEDINRGV